MDVVRLFPVIQPQDLHLDRVYLCRMLRRKTPGG